MAETLLIGIVVLAGFAIVLLMDAHGKARAYEQGRDPSVHHAPETFTRVDLPPPSFNHRDRDHTGSEEE